GRSVLLVRRAERQGRLAAVENARKEGRDLSGLLPVLAAASGKPGPEAPSRSLDEALLPLLLEEQRLLEDYEKDHPQVESIRKRIELTRKLLSRGSSPDAKGKAPPDPVTFYLQSMQLELEDIEQSQA